MDMSLQFDTTVGSTTDGESDSETYSEQPASADNREPAPSDSREPASVNSREPVPANSREPALANSREPVPADSREAVLTEGKDFWSNATREPALSERRDYKSIDETNGSIFRGDDDAETDSRLLDQSFDEKGVEPAEEDTKSKEPVPGLQSNESQFEARCAEEVLSSSDSDNGQGVASLVETKNGSESLGKVEDSGY